MHEDIRGHLILIMAPMASGKGVLIRHILTTFPQVHRLVSCTTRKKRPGEAEGVDYYFINEDDFRKKIADGAFIEWAEFSGNLYGTLHSELDTRLAEGEVVINEIDLQGVQKLRSMIPTDHCTVIYIDAGDWEVLKARALSRAPMSEAELELRHEHYLREITYKHEADFIIKNNDNERDAAKKTIVKIVGDLLTKYKTA